MYVTNAGHQMTSKMNIITSSMRGPNWPFRCLANYVHSQFPARNLCTPFSRYMVLQVRQGTGHFTTSYIKAKQNLPLWDRSFPGRDCDAFVKWNFVKGSRAFPTSITIRLWPISGKAVKNNSAWYISPLLLPYISKKMLCTCPHTKVSNNHLPMDYSRVQVWILLAIEALLF